MSMLLKMPYMKYFFLSGVLLIAELIAKPFAATSLQQSLVLSSSMIGMGLALYGLYVLFTIHGNIFKKMWDMNIK